MIHFKTGMMVTACMVVLAVGWVVAAPVRVTPASNIWQASIDGDLEVLERYVALKADLNQRHEETGSPPLLLATRYRHRPVMERLLDAGADINVTDVRGQTALVVAAHHGEMELVSLLLQRGADVNGYAMPGHPPLTAAVASGKPEIVKMLLDAGARMDLGSNKQWRPLHEAASSNRAEMVSLLLDRGADIEVKTVYGETPLVICAYRGSTEAARLLIERGAKVNVFSANDTILVEAIQHGHRDVAMVLLEAGFDVKLGFPRSDALSAAIGRGYDDVIERLLHSNVPIGEDALAWAIKKNRWQFVPVLVERGAAIPPDAIDDAKAKAIKHNAYEAYAAIVRLPLRLNRTEEDPAEETAVENALALIEAAIKEDEARMNAMLLKLPESHAWAIETAYQFARHEGHIATSRKLQAAVQNYTQAQERLAALQKQLRIACRDGDVKMAVESIEQGADPNHKYVPLNIAIQHGHIDVVRALLEHGAEPNVDASRIPLKFAITQNHPAIVSLLIQHGADPNFPGDGWESPLMDAADTGATEIIAQLLEAGAQVNHIGVSDCTALMHAAKRGHTEAVALLLKAGADRELRDDRGRTAWHLAMMRLHYDVADMIGPGRGDSLENLPSPLAPDWTTPPLEVMRELLEQGVDPNKRGDIYYPLTLAVRRSDLDKVRLLLEYGADPNVPSDLFGQVDKTKTDADALAIGKLLIEAGVDIEGGEDAERTPLQAALIFKNEAWVNLLMEAGANPHAVNHNGHDVFRLIRDDPYMSKDDKTKTRDFVLRHISQGKQP